MSSTTPDPAPKGKRGGVGSFLRRVWPGRREAAASGFELRITFSGMCLFVPRKADAQMHVLLPDTQGVDRHTAILQFDIAHLTAGNSKTAGIRANVNLAQTSLSIPDPPQKTADLVLCPQVVNLYDVTKTALDPTDSGVRSRAIAALLLGDGGMKEVSAGVCWEWLDPKNWRRIAHEARWIMNASGANLTLSLKDITGQVPVPPKLPTLYPITPASGAPAYIDLWVYHVPPKDLPPDADLPKSIGIGNQPMHFMHFYDLYSGSVNTKLPTLRADDGCPNDEKTCPGIDSGGKGGSPYTCMVGGVVP